MNCMWHLSLHSELYEPAGELKSMPSACVERSHEIQPNVYGEEYIESTGRAEEETEEASEN